MTPFKVPLSLMVWCVSESGKDLRLPAIVDERARVSRYFFL